MLNGATILVTGGTGSFGNKFIQMTLSHYDPKKIIVYSRDEMKQWEMAQRYSDDRRIRFFQGDVRDKDRLKRACNEVDFIVHAAAGKIVPTAEYNPFEYIKTNIMGAMHVIDAAIDTGVKRVVALSTDKACNPVNLYGATKLCSDKLFVAGNNYSGSQDSRFAVVRYGNVMGSRGSILPFFMKLAEKGEIPITDERMTRFLISLEEAVKLVWHALEHTRGGEIFVRKCPSMHVLDIAKTVAPQAKIKLIGIRPGEKLHEQMISHEDARSTMEYPSHYTILSPIVENTFELLAQQRIPNGGTPCVDGFAYSSDTNTLWMEPSELREFLKREYGYDPS
jgi:UDP-N-acetylglucosamine 4,6-dehydratase (inverting)